MSLEMKRPGKELWDDVTKADLARHFLLVAPRMLPHLKDRPLTLVRAPDGIDKHRFFQKDAHHLGHELRRCRADDVQHVMAESPQDLVALADQACVELHGWVSRCTHPDVPDRIVFDLDPPDASHFADVQDVARKLHDLLEDRGARPHPMVTGSKGIHLVVPLVAEADFAKVVAFTDTVADVLTRHDRRLTTEVRKVKREGRIFVDTLRNRPRQTAVLPWSTRARPGAPVATPITRDDLDDPGLDPQAWTVGHIPGHDPWKGFFDAAVPLDSIA